MKKYAPETIVGLIVIAVGIFAFGSLGLKSSIPSKAYAETGQKSPSQQIEEIITRYRKTLPQRGDPDTVILDVEVKNKVITWTIVYDGIVDPNYNKPKFLAATKLDTAFINCQFKAKRNVLNIGYTHIKTYFSSDAEELFRFEISKSDCLNMNFKNKKALARDYVVELSKLLPMKTEIGGIVLSVELEAGDMTFTYKDELIQNSQLQKKQKKFMTETLKSYNCSNHLRNFFIKNDIDLREIYLNANGEKLAEILTTKSDCLP